MFIIQYGCGRGMPLPCAYLYLYKLPNTKVNYYNLYGFLHWHTCSGFSCRHLFEFVIRYLYLRYSVESSTSFHGKPRIKITVMNSSKAYRPHSFNLCGMFSHFPVLHSARYLSYPHSSTANTKQQIHETSHIQKPIADKKILKIDYRISPNPEKLSQCNRDSFHKIDALAIRACSLTQSYNRFCKYCQRCGKACLKNNKSCANGNQGSILQTLAVSPVKRCRQSINFRKSPSRRYASGCPATPRSDNKSHHDDNPSHCTA